MLELMVAWTEPGRRLRRGVPVAFPDPIGALWGYEVASSGLFRAVTAPTGGIWSGAATKVTASTGDGLVVRVVGVADLAVHLEALALAAGALIVDSFAYGAARPNDRAEDYLGAALGAGLDVGGAHPGALRLLPVPASVRRGWPPSSRWRRRPGRRRGSAPTSLPRPDHG